MTRFRQALLDELRSRVVADPVPVAAKRRLTPPRLAFGGALVAAAVSTATVLATSGGAGPAYAISTDKDGTVAVAVNRVDDPGEANRELAAAGEGKVKILRPSAPEDCPVADRGTVMALPPGTNRAAVKISMSDKGSEARVQTRGFPDDMVVVLVALLPPGSDRGAFDLAFYKAPGPKCVVAT
ncbi:hypothetical protein K1W54_36720 [Micromonospora sp. CPCC 205371]|nr:hypothetical protein [Micromonospora sp. CPCC 205371]